MAASHPSIHPPRRSLSISALSARSAGASTGSPTPLSFSPFRHRATMNDLKLKRNWLRQENRKFPAELVSVQKDRWARDNVLNRIAVWRSNKFLVQAFEEANGFIRLSICRTEINSQGSWKDGLSWDDLQTLKSEVGFGDQDAFEIYPANRDVVNVANMRHLWVSPTHLPQTWRPPHA